MCGWRLPDPNLPQLRRVSYIGDISKARTAEKHSMTIGRRQWRWRLVGGSLFLLITFSSGWLLAKQGVVTTRDGQRVEGDINEKADEVVVTSHGVNTVIARDNIASLQYSEAFEKQFQDRLAKLDPKDVNGRIELARWALSQQQYNAARDVL